jgi:hypothetical protein
MDLQEQIEAAAVRATSRICAGRAASFGSAGPKDRHAHRALDAADRGRARARPAGLPVPDGRWRVEDGAGELLDAQAARDAQLADPRADLLRRRHERPPKMRASATSRKPRARPGSRTARRRGSIMAPPGERRPPLASVASHHPASALDAARAMERGGLGSGPRRVQENSRAPKSDPARGLVQLINLARSSLPQPLELPAGQAIIAPPAGSTCDAGTAPGALY